jgi:hypothetical protein
MDQVLYVLAILGCGDDSAQCERARVEPVRFTSYVACQEAMAGALERNSDLMFPVLNARCERQGVQMVERRPAPQRVALGG